MVQCTQRRRGVDGRHPARAASLSSRSWRTGRDTSVVRQLVRRQNIFKMRDDIEFNIEFCEEIEKYPCLYDNTRSDYCNRSAQDQAWQKVAGKFGVEATECKERWKNVRGRYTKYKNKLKLPSGSGAKKCKQYYLASHLQFLDSFLRSRQSKGNIVAKEKPTQEEARDSEDESQDGDTHEGFEETTETSTQDTNNSFSDNMPTTPTTAMFPPPPERNGDSSYRKKRKSSIATLGDVNGSACKYFEAKQQMLERRQQNNATSQLDPDMAFLQSILPNMKAMDDRGKMRFKKGILDLAEEILYPQPTRKASGSLINAQSKGSFISTLSRDSSMDTLERDCSTEGAPPMPTNDDATSGDRFFSVQQEIEQEENFNMERYLSFLPK